jgi:hypothetical protein
MSKGRGRQRRRNDARSNPLTGTSRLAGLLRWVHEDRDDVEAYHVERSLRSSWLMLDTNCDLLSLACWSCRFFSSISSKSRTFSIAITA